MRLTKAGKQNKQDLSIQQQGWKPADPRAMLAMMTENYLIMLERWNDGSRAAMIAREACKNLMESLGKGGV